MRIDESRSIVFLFHTEPTNLLQHINKQMLRCFGQKLFKLDKEQILNPLNISPSRANHRVPKIRCWLIITLLQYDIFPYWGGMTNIYNTQLFSIGTLATYFEEWNLNLNTAIQFRYEKVDWQMSSAALWHFSRPTALIRAWYSIKDSKYRLHDRLERFL